MTVQELINELYILDPDLEVAIYDDYTNVAQQIRCIFKDKRNEINQEEVIFIEGGQLL